jgi:hypothetical protein
MTLTTDDWRDIWSEYRPMVFDRLGMDHDRAHTFVSDALELADRLGVDTDGDAIVDALKEFAVRLDDRGGGNLRTELAIAHDLQLFGCRARTIGPVLARLGELLR